MSGKASDRTKQTKGKNKMIKRTYSEADAFERIKLKYPTAKKDHRKVMMPIMKHLLYWTKNGFRRDQVARLPDFWSITDAKKVGGKSFVHSLLLSMSDGTAGICKKDRFGKLLSSSEFQQNNFFTILSDGYFFVNDVLSEDFEMHIIEIENTSPITQRRKHAYTTALCCADILGDIHVCFHLFDKSGARERIYKTTSTHATVCEISGHNLFDCQYDSLGENEKALIKMMGESPLAA
jgi:hypothetical protein